MAAILKCERHEGGGELNLGTFEGSRTFKVTGGTSTTRESDVYAVTGIPAIGDAHPSITSSWCRKLTANRDGATSLGIWTVTAFYSNGPLSQSQEERLTVSDPTARAASIECVVIREQVPCVQDRDGNPYLNSAGDPFDPPLTKSRSRLQIKVRKNYSAIPNYFWDLGDTINTAAVTIGHGINKTFPAKTLLFVPEGAPELATDNGVSYMEVRYSLDVMIETWDREVLDVGYNFKPGGGSVGLLTTREAFLDSNGDRPNLPQLLDGDGDATTTATYLTFGDYDEGDWSVIAAVLA